MILNNGFVPVEQIQNIFSEEIKKLEEDYGRQGIPTNHRLLFEHIDNIKLRIIQMAQFNLQKYLKDNPHLKKKEHEEKRLEVAEKSTSKDWRTRVEEQKKQAIAEAYRE